MINKMPAYNPYLSKSLYVKGLQCHKALWLQKYQPELRDEVSDSQQAAFDSGTEVGILAQQLFSGGIEVPYDGLSPSEQVLRTQYLMDSGTQTIYEASFSYDGIFCKVDILHHGQNGWELHEVKAAAECKDHYIDDIALQYYVLTGTGLKVAYAGLVYINNTYVRQGAIDVGKLFSLLDLTGTIRSMPTTVMKNVSDLRDMLRKPQPIIDIGPHCESPYGCSFIGHCWSHIPENSVFDFRGHGKPDAWKLYQNSMIHMADVPIENLRWRQQQQRDGLLNQKNHLDPDEVRAFLDSLWYPLYFMDFETTCRIPVPPYNGIRPFRPAPYQFSLHWQDGPDLPLNHTEFLGNPDEDPQEAFITTLLESIPQDACILVWNQTFENGILNYLSFRLPRYKVKINKLQENIRDLMEPFMKRHIYHGQFNGSYSIKAVLPVLVPEMDYDSLDVGDGQMASDSWMKMVHSSSAEERDGIRKQLLEYCYQDTLAMVRILECVRTMVAN